MNAHPHTPPTDVETMHRIHYLEQHWNDLYVKHAKFIGEIKRDVEQMTKLCDTQEPLEHAVKQCKQRLSKIEAILTAYNHRIEDKNV